MWDFLASDRSNKVVAAKLAFTVLSFWLFAAWSIGALPTDAFGAGFAKSEDAAFNTKLLLERELLSAKRSQCRANTEEGALYWTQRLIELKNVYLDRLGRKYDEPSCEVLTPGD